MIKKRPTLFSLFLLLIINFGCVSESSENSNPIREGRAIFRKGAETTGVPIEGYWVFNKEKVPAKGAALACAGCHSIDGRGGAEAGRFSADIRSKTLFSKKLDKNGNLVRNKYSFKSIINLLENGIDQNGKTISNLMPRFDLSKTQKKEIFTYLTRLGEDFDPGISDSEIKIALVGKSQKTSQTRLESIRSYFSKNFPFGFFGRKVIVDFVSNKSISEIENSYFILLSDGIEFTNFYKKNVITLTDLPIFFLSSKSKENSILDDISFSLFPTPKQEGRIIGKYLQDKKDQEVGFFSNNSKISNEFISGIEEQLGRTIQNAKDSKRSLDFVIVLTDTNTNNKELKITKKTVFVYPSWERVKELKSVYVYPMSLKIDEQFIPKEIKKSTNSPVDFLKEINSYTVSQIISSCFAEIGPNMSRPGFISALRKIKINNRLLPQINFNKENFGIKGAFLIDVKNKRELGWIEP